MVVDIWKSIPSGYNVQVWTYSVKAKKCNYCKIILSILFWVFVSGCGGSDKPSGPKCSIAISGTPWSPTAAGVGASNHDASVVLSQTVTEKTGPITGLAQGTNGREITVSIDMTQDLGAYGSLTLMAQSTNFPSALQGAAFAYLVSLHDGTNEYVNLASSCGTSGLYSCPGGACSVNTNCKPNTPSAFLNRDNWEQRQGYSSSAVNYPSVNTFPTCNWTGGTDGSQADPSCAFVQTFFPASPTPVRLRYGVTYTAKYVLIADSYASLTGYTAGLKVTAVKKTSNHATVGGAVDLNFILVGSTNVQASRTAKGQQNLNTLITNVANFYSHANVNLKLGTVRAIEWPCESGGETYANVTLSELGNLLASSSSIVPAGLDTKAMNVFLVSSIKDDSSSDSNLTILGVDGAIGGPVLNGTAISGMAVSTFDTLDKYNPSCPANGSPCAITLQEKSFFELSETVAHEMGHYFGLNHLSEAVGTTHDFIRDTPVCTATENVGGKNYLTINSCLNLDANVFSGTGNTCSANCGTYNSASGTYCPSATACQFNYIMWWTTKNFKNGNSDGTLFSTQEAGVISYHPLVQ